MKPHILTIKRREGSTGISTGLNTIVLLDGKPLHGCSRVSVDIRAKRIAKVRLDLYTAVDLETVTVLRNYQVKKKVKK